MKANLNDLKLELFLRNRNNLIWTTKNNVDIPISKMSDEHLINTIKLIEKNNIINNNNEAVEKLDDCSFWYYYY